MSRVIRPTGETLAGVQLLSSLTPEQRQEIAARCQGRCFPEGHRIVGEQCPSDEVYFLISGRVRARIYSASGKEVSFRDLTVGESFGDLAAIDGEPRCADVETQEESTVAYLSAAAFRAVMREHPAVADAVMKQLVALIRRLSERVVEFSTLGVRNRIHAEILRRARAAATQGGNQVQLRPPPTHAELASHVATTRYAVTRELGALEKAGILARGRGRSLTVLDLERLEQLVDGVKDADSFDA